MTQLKIDTNLNKQRIQIESNLELDNIPIKKVDFNQKKDHVVSEGEDKNGKVEINDKVYDENGDREDKNNEVENINVEDKNTEGKYKNGEILNIVKVDITNDVVDFKSVQGAKKLEDERTKPSGTFISGKSGFIFYVLCIITAIFIANIK